VPGCIAPCYDIVTGRGRRRGDQAGRRAPVRSAADRRSAIADVEGPMRRRRYTIVGTGSRAGLYIDGISGAYRESAELVALCDVSQARMDWHNRRLVGQEGGAPPPTYLAHDFDRMVAD